MSKSKHLYPTIYKFGSITLGGGNLFKCLTAYIILFLVFFLFYGIKGYSEPVPEYMVFLQFFYFVFYTAALIGAYKINFPRKEFYLFIFIYSLLAGFLIRGLSWEFRNEPFMGGIDSVTYDNFGNNAYRKDLSYSEYLEMINNDGFGIDDYGMPTVVYFVYRLFGPGVGGQNFMIILNSIIIASCAWRLNGIMIYYGIERKIKRFLVAVYAFFPFLSLTAGVGLKENFFLFVILSAFYYMFRYKETKSLKYFIYSSLFCFGSLFFRVATFAMLTLCFLLCRISNKKNGKFLMRLMVIGGIAGIFILNIAMTALFGRGLDAFLAIAEARSGQVNEGVGSAGKWIVSALAVIMGPFPNFAKLSEYALVHSAGVLMKGVIGFPVIYGIWYYSKKYIFKFYPLFIYFILNSLMVILVGVSLDMRYQIPFFPLTLPYAGKILQEKYLKKYFICYIFFLFILIWFYNKR